jgi:hypothetical protein
MEAFMSKATIKYLLLTAVFLTLSVAPVYAQYANYNKALLLDGSGSWAGVSASNVPTLSTQLTVEAWIKTTLIAADQAVISRYKDHSGSNLDDSFMLSVHGGYARLQVAIGATYYTLDGATWIADGQWHHVAGVYNGYSMVLYIDGNRDGVFSQSFGYGQALIFLGALNNPSGTNLRIGAAYYGMDFPGLYFVGQIDEVRLWDRALSQSEIQTNRRLALRQKSLAYPNLQAAWRFNGPYDRGGAILFGNATEIGTNGITGSDPGLFENTKVYFSGGEFLNIQNGSSLGSGWNQLTVEAWVRSGSTRGTLQSVVSKFRHNSDSLADDAYFLGINSNGSARFEVAVVNNYNLVNSTTYLLDDTWHHLAGVFDGSQIRLYVDGRLEASGYLYGAIPSNPTPLFIGASQEGTSGVISDLFFGGIDDVRIWSVPRSQSQIQDYMNSCSLSSLGANTPGLVARWGFEGDFINVVNLYRASALFDGILANSWRGALRFDPAADSVCSYR